MSNTFAQTVSPPATLVAAKSDSNALTTGREVRLASRTGSLTATTSGLAASYVQANLIVLPSRYASDFRQLCARNPVPCPLIAESTNVGDFKTFKSHLPSVAGSAIVSDCDIRCDIPRYNVYRDSRLVAKGCLSVEEEWTDDHIAFLIGCSFSFETALTAASLVPCHTLLGRNVPMYRTTIPLNPAGAFISSTYVVSMRCYRTCDIPRVREVTRPFVATHGEPIAWGWDAVARLGIKDLNAPEWGDVPLSIDGQPLVQKQGGEDHVPVFWGCGVTPQEAVMKAGIEGVVMSHAPGHMLLLDCEDSDILEE